MKYKAAIFDLDGTLIDSTWVWYSMIEKFCKDFDIKDKMDCMGETVHMPPTEFIEFIRKRYNLKESVLEIKEKLLETATYFYSEKVPLKKGAKNLLHLMKENSIKMAIATSCFVELTEIVLKKLDVYNLFSCFLYSEELKTNKKSADLYLAAAKKLGIPCSECAIFEDISLPLEKVKKYKMGYFGVEDERREQAVKNELKLNADCYIEDFDQFIKEGSFKKFFSLKGEVV